MQEEVSRILTSNVCETIASTVSRNQEEIDELEQLFQQRSQQILDIQRKLAGEVSFFERLHAKDKRLHMKCESMESEIRVLQSNFAGFKDIMLTEMNGWQQLISKEVNALFEELQEIHRQKVEKLQSNLQQPSSNTDLTEKITHLTSQVQSLTTALEKERETANQLRRINTQLKKQELSRIFQRKGIDGRSRRNTADSDILKTLEPTAEALDLTRLTQPNFQQTTLIDFTRKRSMLVLSSSAAVLERWVFDFDQLVEEHYEGKLLSAKKVGKGVAVYQQNYQYKGEFIRNMRQGQGTLLRDSKEIYSGEWHNGLFHGKGKLNVFPTGKTYRQWKSYCGSFECGRVQGLGTVTLMDGTSMICTFRNGQPQNLTVMFDKKSNVFYGETTRKGVFNRKL